MTKQLERQSTNRTSNSLRLVSYHDNDDDDRDNVSNSMQQLSRPPLRITASTSSSDGATFASPTFYSSSASSPPFPIPSRTYSNSRRVERRSEGEGRWASVIQGRAAQRKRRNITSDGSDVVQIVSSDDDNSDNNDNIDDDDDSNSSAGKKHKQDLSTGSASCRHEASVIHGRGMREGGAGGEEKSKAEEILLTHIKYRGHSLAASSAVFTADRLTIYPLNRFTKSGNNGTLLRNEIVLELRHISTVSKAYHSSPRVLCISYENMQSVKHLFDQIFSSSSAAAATTSDFTDERSLILVAAQDISDATLDSIGWIIFYSNRSSTNQGAPNNDSNNSSSSSSSSRVHMTPLSFITRTVNNRPASSDTTRNGNSVKSTQPWFSLPKIPEKCSRIVQESHSAGSLVRKSEISRICNNNRNSQCGDRERNTSVRENLFSEFENDARERGLVVDNSDAVSVDASSGTSSSLNLVLDERLDEVNSERIDCTDSQNSTGNSVSQEKPEDGKNPECNAEEDGRETPEMEVQTEEGQESSAPLKKRSESPIAVSVFNRPIVRLFTYPPPPAVRGISVTNEDLFCLNSGEYINDVIIDFYLKYLFTEVLTADDRARTHVFSSFFYSQLVTRQPVPRDSTLSDAQLRHSRVKTWTRRVDIFSKDFVIVPINEHYHWFLAIICFPGLAAEWCDPERMDEERVQDKQPSVLIFDSLKEGARWDISTTLREYLQVEWDVRKSESFGQRNFSKNTIKGNMMRVPQQNNSTDCGTYVLHYVECFYRRPPEKYTLPIKGVESWFTMEEVEKKRESLRKLILQLTAKLNPALRYNPQEDGCCIDDQDAS